MENIVNNAPVTRLVLTHWEPEAYEHFPAEQDEMLLLELVTAALIHEEVLIKDTDIVLNDRIFRFLDKPQNFDIFSELIRTGIVKVLTIPSAKYHSDTPVEDVRESPITARAHNIRTFKEKPWEPNTDQKKFYKKLDLLLKFDHNVRLVCPFPSEHNPFAEWLAYLLEKQEQIVTIPEFKHINPKVAKQFIKFCRGEELWLDFVRKRDATLIRRGDDEAFFRSQAYRCLSFFPIQSGMINLIQSVFNACYCYWEDSSGRFVNGMLVEPPYIYEERDEAPATRHLKQLQLVPSGESRAIPLSPGIGEVLIETRKSTAFRHVQELVGLLKRGIIDEKKTTQGLRSLAEVFAANANRKFAVRTENPFLWQLLGWCSVSALTGVAAFGFIPSPVVWVGTSAAGGAALLGPKIQKVIQSRSRVRAIRQSVLNALEFRCSDINVPSVIAMLKN